MEFYCPRCDTNYPEIEQTALEAGECTTCSGQLSLGVARVGGAVDGIVAMTFDGISGVGQPLYPQLEMSDVDTHADFDSVAEARTKAIAAASAKAQHEAYIDDDEDEDDFADDAAPPLDLYDLAQESPTSEKGSMEEQREELHTEGADGGAPSEPTTDERAARTSHTLTGDGGGGAAGEPGDDTGAETDVPSAPRPAHLAPPGIDFSMPSLPDFGSAPSLGDDDAPPAGDTGPEARDDAGDASTAPGAERESPGGAATGAKSAAAEGGAALPAHLQLPSFPKFDMSFDTSSVLGGGPPSHEDHEPAAPEPPAPHAATAPHAAPASPAPAATPPGVPAHLIPGQLPQAAGGHGGLPAMPAMPPVAPAPAARPAGDFLPSLPDLGLPAIGVQHKEVTLLGSAAAEELKSELASERRSVVPFLLIPLLLIGGAGGVGFWKKDDIVAMLDPPKKVEAKLSKEDEAQAALAEGISAAKNDKLSDAVQHYEKALELDPKLSAAHVRLAVAFAKLKEEGKAVEHYRGYLALEPNAKDAKDVQKIIDDWEAAQKKKKADAEAVATEDEKKKKKKKKR